MFKLFKFQENNLLTYSLVFLIIFFGFVFRFYNINYENLSGLSNEIRSKFKTIKPKTLGQALRIDGVTPAAAYILLSHVKRKSIKRIA